LFFGRVIAIPFAFELRLRVIAGRWVQLGDTRHQVLSLIDTAAHDAGRFQVIFKEIRDGFTIIRIQRDGLLEILMGFPRVSRSCKDTADFGATPVGVSQEAMDFGATRRQGQGLLEGFTRLLVIA